MVRSRIRTRLPNRRPSAKASRVLARAIPILERSGDGEAVIEPSRIYARCARVPSRCVLCFFHDVLQQRAQRGELRVVRHLTGEGPPNPVYVLQAQEPVTIAFPGLTAPFAACTLEELIALGGRQFVCCGGAGALQGAIPAGHVVIPTAALRDEGTSYHYQRPGQFSLPHPSAVQAVRDACRARDIPFLEGPTWTTDGVFRETPSMVRRRRDQGCVTVEMEAAACFAVARFRGVALAHLLYAADDVSGTTWNERGWRSLHEVRAGLLDLAIDAVRRILDGTGAA